MPSPEQRAGPATVDDDDDDDDDDCLFSLLLVLCSFASFPSGGRHTAARQTEVPLDGSLVSDPSILLYDYRGK